MRNKEMEEKLPTVEEVIKALSKFPSTSTVLAYEGEGGNGLVIKDPEKPTKEVGWIPTNERGTLKEK